jgi:hypothetical protein
MTALTDEVVAAVHDSFRLFPEVVITLAEQEVEQDPALDKIAVMRRIRDELNSRISH